MTNTNSDCYSASQPFKGFSESDKDTVKNLVRLSLNEVLKGFEHELKESLIDIDIRLITDVLNAPNERLDIDEKYQLKHKRKEIMTSIIASNPLIYNLISDSSDNLYHELVEYLFYFCESLI